MSIPVSPALVDLAEKIFVAAVSDGVSKPDVAQNYEEIANESFVAARAFFARAREEAHRR
ncbi:hypothetical protein JY438_06850 [Stenotrophomonas maltophilia]|jgi:hypothetical protein|nr:hypothetical protein [Stenotrophomonas maltophilia]